MENQDLFPSKDKSKKLTCRLLQFLFGALRVNISTIENRTCFQNNVYARINFYSWTNIQA